MVGYRSAGEMFGETSLLQAGVATASIAADTEATVVCIEGTFLEQLFQSNPQLPGRFFCFLAAYQVLTPLPPLPAPRWVGWCASHTHRPSLSSDLTRLAAYQARRLLVVHPLHPSGPPPPS